MEESNDFVIERFGLEHCCKGIITAFLDIF